MVCFLSTSKGASCTRFLCQPGVYAEMTGVSKIWLCPKVSYRGLLSRVPVFLSTILGELGLNICHFGPEQASLERGRGVHLFAFRLRAV